MEKKEIKSEVERVKDIVEKDIDMSKVEEILNSNIYEFAFEKDKYRVSRPTFKQKQEANKKRMEIYLKLMQEVDEKGKKKNLTEKEWIELHKAHGTDIDEMNKKHDFLEKEKMALMYKLGKSIKEKKPKQEFEIFEKEIRNIDEQQKLINIEKSLLLDSSIETQVNIFIYTFLAWLVTEKLVEEKWIKSWKSYEDYMDTDERLVNVTVYYSSLLTKNEVPFL